MNFALIENSYVASFRAIFSFQMLASPHGNSKSTKIGIFNLMKLDVLDMSVNIYYNLVNGAIQ